MNPRGRPQTLPEFGSINWQRWRTRTLYLRFVSRATIDFLAIYLSRLRSVFTITERHPHQLEQTAAFFVGFGGGDNGDLHAAHLVDFVVLDLREDQLFAQAERVVAAPVERLAADPAKVAS